MEKVANGNAKRGDLPAEIVSHVLDYVAEPAYLASRMLASSVMHA